MGRSQNLRLLFRLLLLRPQYTTDSIRSTEGLREADSAGELLRRLIAAASGAEIHPTAIASPHLMDICCGSELFWLHHLVEASANSPANGFGVQL